MDTLKTLGRVVMGIAIGVEIAFIAMLDAYCDRKEYEKNIYVD